MSADRDRYITNVYGKMLSAAVFRHSAGLIVQYFLLSVQVVSLLSFMYDDGWFVVMEKINNRGRRLYIFKVFIEYPLNLGSGCISMFSVNLTFDKTLVMQFCYCFFLQKSPLFGL